MEEEEEKKEKGGGEGSETEGGAYVKRSYAAKPKIFTVQLFICYPLTYTSCLSLIATSLTFSTLTVLIFLFSFFNIPNMLLPQGFCTSYNGFYAFPSYPCMDGHLHLLLVFVQIPSSQWDLHLLPPSKTATLLLSRTSYIPSLLRFCLKHLLLVWKLPPSWRA